MMRLVKESAYKLSVIAGLTRAATRRAGHKILVLAYHDVIPGGLNSVRNFDGLHVRVARFERQMRYVAAQYHVVPLDDLLAPSVQARGDKPLAAITFDDGYQGTYRYAVPILRGLGLPATVFIVTDFALHGRPFWWERLWAMVDAARRPVLRVPVQGSERILPLATVRDRLTAVRQLMHVLRALPAAAREAHLSCLAHALAVDQDAITTCAPISGHELREMARGGITVGSHGCSHDSFLQLSPDSLREELLESKRILEALTGGAVTWLSYPYGDYSLEVAAAAARAGFRGAVTTVEGLNDGIPDPYAVRRCGVDDRLSYAHFLVAISGMRDSLKDRLHVRPAPAPRAAHAAQDGSN